MRPHDATLANNDVTPRIRPATPADHEFLCGLARAAYRDVVVRQFGEWDDAVQGARFAAKLEGAFFRIGMVGDRAVAAVWSEERVDHVFLHELLVLPEFQNRGIGSELLAVEVANARAAGKPLRLHTLRLNRAQDFYARHGFAVTLRGDVYVDMERAVDRLP
jgi:GNAT superfamily N-acetyltransferase